MPLSQTPFSINIGSKLTFSNTPDNQKKENNNTNPEKLKNNIDKYLESAWKMREIRTDNIEYFIKLKESISNFINIIEELKKVLLEKYWNKYEIYLELLYEQSNNNIKIIENFINTNNKDITNVLAVPFVLVPNALMWNLVKILDNFDNEKEVDKHIQIFFHRAFLYYDKIKSPNNDIIFIRSNYSKKKFDFIKDFIDKQLTKKEYLLLNKLQNEQELQINCNDSIMDILKEVLSKLKRIIWIDVNSIENSNKNIDVIKKYNIDDFNSIEELYVDNFLQKRPFNRFEQEIFSYILMVKINKYKNINKEYIKEYTELVNSFYLGKEEKINLWAKITELDNKYTLSLPNN